MIIDCLTNKELIHLVPSTALEEVLQNRLDIEDKNKQGLKSFIVDLNPTHYSEDKMNDFIESNLDEALKAFCKTQNMAYELGITDSLLIHLEPFFNGLLKLASEQEQLLDKIEYI